MRLQYKPKNRRKLRTRFMKRGPGGGGGGGGAIFLPPPSRLFDIIRTAAPIVTKLSAPSRASILLMVTKTFSKGWPIGWPQMTSE